MLNDYSKRFPNNTIHPTAIIYPNVTMGTGNYIGAYCIIGDIPESVKYFDVESKGVVIGNNCRFTKQVTIDAGTEEATKIYDNVLMLKNSHVGHDSVISSRVELRCNATIGGHCFIGYNTKLMLHAVIHPRMIVPENVILGMGCVVTKKTKLESNSTYIGVPAKKLNK